MSRSILIFSIILLAFTLGACNEEPRADLRKAVKDAFKQDDIAFEAMSYNFLSMLEAHRYAELDEQMQALQKMYEQGANEWAVLSAYSLFSTSEERYGPDFDAWVEQNKGYWTGRLARGIYHVSVAWDKRGTKYISETPREQIEQMSHHFSLAKKDINAALKQTPRAIVGYSMLLQIARGTGTETDKQKVIDAALKISAATYYLRWQHMVGLEPKWGGSMQRLREFAHDAQKWREQNPRLYALLGYEHSVMAEQAESQEKYEKAVQSYTKALAYAPVGGWFRSRAWCYKKLDRLDEANRDLSAVLEFSPDDVDLLVRRADIYITKKHYPSAIADLEHALELNPKFELASNNLGWIYAKQGDNERAAIYFDKTLEYDPDNEYALSRCGVVRERLGQLDKAELCLARAVVVAPKDASVWRNYGDVLFKRGDPKHLRALANYLKYADPELEKETYIMTKNYLAEKNYHIEPEEKSSPPARNSSTMRRSGSD